MVSPSLEHWYLQAASSEDRSHWIMMIEKCIEGLADWVSVGLLALMADVE